MAPRGQALSSVSFPNQPELARFLRLDDLSSSSKQNRWSVLLHHRPLFVGCAANSSLVPQRTDDTNSCKGSARAGGLAVVLSNDSLVKLLSSPVLVPRPPPAPPPGQTVRPHSCHCCPQAHPHLHPPAHPPAHPNRLTSADIKGRAFTALHKRIINRRVAPPCRPKPQMGLGGSHKSRTWTLSSIANGVSCPLSM